MKVCIVSYDTQGWIQTKIARKLCEHLRRLGVDVEIRTTPDSQAEINHHIIYLGYDGRKNSIDTLMFTHFHESWESELARHQLKNAAMGVCMSSDTVSKLVRQGFPAEKLCVINPAQDGLIRPRKIAVGITTRVYADQRKRERMLADLAARISPSDFEFRIMGAGWKPVIRILEKHGFEVRYSSRFHYQQYCTLIRNLDYFLYLGLDEGSLGFLDALAAGIPTIVSPQGFHLDVEQGITHAFNDLEDLTQIFSKIVAERDARCRSVASWSWAEYARNHLLIWQELIEKREQQSESVTENEDEKESVTENEKESARKDASAVEEIARIIAAVPTVPETILQKCGRIFLQEGLLPFGRRQIAQRTNRFRKTREKETGNERTTDDPSTTKVAPNKPPDPSR